MKLSTFIITLSLLVLSFSLNAQITPLKIGDKVPDVFLKSIRQYDTTYSSPISAFKNKLLILDFWATWCSPCIAALPRLDSLQEKFGDRIQILSVTRQPDSLVSNFFQKVYREKKIKPLSVVADTLLNSLFPHNQIPYYVWINSDGTVIAITETNQVNEKAIQEALHGNVDNLKIWIDLPNHAMPKDQPLFLLNNPFITDKGIVRREVNTELIKFQSILTDYIKNVRSIVEWDSSSYRAKNIEIAFLYKSIYNVSYYGYRTNLFHNKARFKIEVNDPSIVDRITNSKSGREYVEWLRLNGICYELLWSNGGSWKDRFEILNQDLDRYISKPLGITSKIEKRDVDSYILKRTINVDSFISKGGKASENYDAFSYSLSNMPLSYFINRLQGYFHQQSHKPFFNETGYQGNVDLKLDCNMSDIESINKELKKYGLQFITAFRKADVLVIKDRE